MDSFIQGAQAGQQLVRPIARGMEARIEAGLHREQQAERRRQADIAEELQRENLDLRRKTHEHNARGQYERLQAEVSAANEHLAQLTKEREAAAHLGNDSYLAEIGANIAIASEFIEAKKQNLLSGKPQPGLEPKATVTRKLPDGSTARYEVPVSELEARHGQQAPDALAPRRRHSYDLGMHKFDLDVPQDQHLRILDILHDVNRYPTDVEQWPAIREVLTAPQIEEVERQVGGEDGSARDLLGGGEDGSAPGARDGDGGGGGDGSAAALVEKERIRQIEADLAKQRRREQAPAEMQRELRDAFGLARARPDEPALIPLWMRTVGSLTREAEELMLEMAGDPDEPRRRILEARLDNIETAYIRKRPGEGIPWRK